MKAATTTSAPRRGQPAGEEARLTFAADVARGLSARPRALPALYLYDALGSQLFEAICELPWYPITRAETRLLERHARTIVDGFGGGTELVELGSGSGEKLAILAGALAGGPRRVHLVDVSARALARSCATLERLPNVSVACHEATFEEGLRRLAAGRADGGRRLVAFLGSNIGNFDPPAAVALLREIRRALRRGDGLLLGADLVRPEADLLRAYDDPLGVTAAFDKNLLCRINRELGGDFDLAAFRHGARWEPAHARVEMHLVSARRQVVRVPLAGVEATFEEGDSIWTESSYKYTPHGLVELGRRAGFARAGQWLDPDPGFCTTRFLVDGS